jgi:hypothetical protein
MLPKFRDEGEPQRWFLHHTILACRREGPPRGAKEDLLVAVADPAPSPPYVAFVRAVRALPQQQMEAVILHHGESFNLRYMAVAMDCSTAAAQTHLNAATETLQLVAGDQLATLLSRLRAAYQRLSPAERVQVPTVGRLVRRHVWPRRLWRTVKWLIVITLLAAIAWAAWKILPNLEF